MKPPTTRKPRRTRAQILADNISKQEVVKKKEKRRADALLTIAKETIKQRAREAEEMANAARPKTRTVRSSVPIDVDHVSETDPEDSANEGKKAGHGKAVKRGGGVTKHAAHRNKEGKGKAKATDDDRSTGIGFEIEEEEVPTGHASAPGDEIEGSDEIVEVADNVSMVSPLLQFNPKYIDNS